MTNMHGTGNRGGWQWPDASLGTLAHRAGLLSTEELETALVEGRRTGRRLREVLLQKGWVDENDLARLLAGQKGLSFVSLASRGFDPDVARLLREDLCRFHQAVAVERRAESVVVAIADPTDEAAVADVRDDLGGDVELVVATGTEIRGVLDHVFGARDEASGAPEPTPAPSAAPVPLVGAGGLRVASPPAEPVAEPPAAGPEAEEGRAAAGEPGERWVHAAHDDDAASELELALQPVRRAEPEGEVVAFAATELSDEPAPEAAFEPDAGRAWDGESGAWRAADAEPTDQVVPESVDGELQPFRLVLELEGEEDAELASFADEIGAERAAEELIAEVERGEWPRVGRRFVRPGRILALRIDEHQGEVAAGESGAASPAPDLPS